MASGQKETGRSNRWTGGDESRNVRKTGRNESCKEPNVQWDWKLRLRRSKEAQYYRKTEGSCGRQTREHSRMQRKTGQRYANKKSKCGGQIAGLRPRDVFQSSNQGNRDWTFLCQRRVQVNIKRAPREPAKSYGKRLLLRPILAKYLNFKGKTSPGD